MPKKIIRASKGIQISLFPTHLRKLADILKSEGIGRSELIRRWISEAHKNLTTK